MLEINAETTKDFNQQLSKKVGTLLNASENDKSDIDDCNETAKSNDNRLVRVLCIICRGYFIRNNYNKHFRLNHATDKSIFTKTVLAASRRGMQNYDKLASKKMRVIVLPHLLAKNKGKTILYLRNDAKTVDNSFECGNAQCYRLSVSFVREKREPIQLCLGLY